MPRSRFPVRGSRDGACHVCGEAAVRETSGYRDLPRVTSDCRPWPEGGRLGVCPACGTVQTIPDESWQAEAAEIYRGYHIYAQAGGEEQVVFDERGGEPTRRSARLVEQVQGHCALPARGRLLDVGCGNGAFMRAFHERAPGWAMAGTELSSQYQAVVEAIPGVERLYTDGIEGIPGSFDLVSLVHVLEHIPRPREMLELIRRKLDRQGVVLVEVPDLEQNAFDLVIADHCSHFTMPSLSALVESAGFEIVVSSASWVPKELSVMARPGTAGGRCAAAQHALADAAVGWLEALIAQGQALAASVEVGIFGSSIGATWLFGSIGPRVACFVDEDPSRVGRTHLGRPIVHPSAVPAGDHVLLALPPGVAGRIQPRLSREFPLAQWHLPPSMPAVGA